MVARRVILHWSLALSALCLILGCAGDDDGTPGDYKESMRSFVEAISTWARSQDSDFIVIPQNGQELLTRNGEEDGSPHNDYINAIDGVGREDLFYGYNADNEATPSSESDYMVSFLDVAVQNGLSVLVTDYCSGTANMDDSYSKNEAKGYVSFAAPSRELDRIPTYPPKPYNSHTDSVQLLSDAKNFLYLINPDSTFTSREEFIMALFGTDHDVLIIDAFYGDLPLGAAAVGGLKSQGSRTRLVIAYMSIGEAEDYRYYWNASWATSPPSWLAEENPEWEGNYKVRYWQKGWQKIIYGNKDSYLQKILDAGFDGVYLDIIDAFEYFESD